MFTSHGDRTLFIWITPNIFFLKSDNPGVSILVTQRITNLDLLDNVIIINNTKSYYKLNINNIRKLSKTYHTYIYVYIYIHHIYFHVYMCTVPDQCTVYMYHTDAFVWNDLGHKPQYIQLLFHFWRPSPPTFHPNINIYIYGLYAVLMLSFNICTPHLTSTSFTLSISLYIIHAYIHITWCEICIYGYVVDTDIHDFCHAKHNANHVYLL